jgi:hypothetical protein
VTARWVVDISEARDLDIVWEPISLRMKNTTSPDSEHYPVVAWSTKLLRVMESVRKAGGDDAVFPLYIEHGRRIHHDREREWDPAGAPAAVGLDISHAAAAEDEAWDEVVRSAWTRASPSSATTWARRSSPTRPAMVAPSPTSDR